MHERRLRVLPLGRCGLILTAGCCVPVGHPVPTTTDRPALRRRAGHGPDHRSAPGRAGAVARPARGVPADRRHPRRETGADRGGLRPAAPDHPAAGERDRRHARPAELAPGSARRAARPGRDRRGPTGFSRRRRPGRALGRGRRGPHAGAPHADLVLIDSGLDDRGALDFTVPGLVAATPAEVAGQLKASGNLPDLRGFTVILVGIGYTAAPQPRCRTSGAATSPRSGPRS